MAKSAEISRQILENAMIILMQAMNANASSPMLIDKKTNELVYKLHWAQSGRN